MSTAPGRGGKGGERLKAMLRWIVLLCHAVGAGWWVGFTFWLMIAFARPIALVGLVGAALHTALYALAVYMQRKEDAKGARGGA